MCCSIYMVCGVQNSGLVVWGCVERIVVVSPFVNNYLCGITPICYDRHPLNSTTKVQQKIHKTVPKH